MDALTIYLYHMEEKNPTSVGLPYNTHCDILPVLCDAQPVFDVLCKRVLSFLLTVTVILSVLCLDMQSCMVVCCRHWDAMHCIVVLFCFSFVLFSCSRL